MAATTSELYTNAIDRFDDYRKATEFTDKIAKADVYTYSLERIAFREQSSVLDVQTRVEAAYWNEVNATYGEAA